MVMMAALLFMLAVGDDYDNADSAAYDDTCGGYGAGAGGNDVPYRYDLRN
jgi:hypothetical protein